MVKSYKFPKSQIVVNRTCLAIGVFCVILGYFGISLYEMHKCSQAALSEVLGESQRHKVLAFVGIYTGFSSVGRRKALRNSWMPSDPDGLRRLEERTGLAIRFVIGRSSNISMMGALWKEIQKYNDFLLLDIEEKYSNLSFKTVTFFKEAYRLYDCNFYVKMNDDIYLRPDRLSLLLSEDRFHPRTYIGCMKNGRVIKDPKDKWYERNYHILGPNYYLYASGTIYALSSDTVSCLVAVRNDRFRSFRGNEDVLIGSWMLAMNINHEHEKEFCQTKCTTSSIAVWNEACSGLCHPEQQLIELHKMDICSKSPTMGSSD